MINWIKKLFKKKEEIPASVSSITEWVDEKGVPHKKFVIAVGNSSKEKAEEQIGKLIASYKEDVEWDDSIGELKINGEKNLPYNKTIWFPSPDTDSGVKIEEIKSDKK